MIPQPIEGANDKRVASPGTESWVGALRVRVEEVDGFRWQTSAWRPSPAELEALNKGACVHLRLSAPRHPVVSLGVGPVPGLGDLVGLDHADVSTPAHERMCVWDEDKGDAVSRPVVAVNCAEGWADVWIMDPDQPGKPKIEDGRVCVERLCGHFSLRWA
jgi:hypothetical protein